MTNPEKVLNCITLYTNTSEEITAFLLKDENETILVAFNPAAYPCDLSLPEGNWNVYVADDQANDVALLEASGEALIQPISAFVAILNQ